MSEVLTGGPGQIGQPGGFSQQKLLLAGKLRQAKSVDLDIVFLGVCYTFSQVPLYGGAYQSTVLGFEAKIPAKHEQEQNNEMFIFNWHGLQIIPANSLGIYTLIVIVLVFKMFLEYLLISNILCNILITALGEPFSTGRATALILCFICLF